MIVDAVGLKSGLDFHLKAKKTNTFSSRYAVIKMSNPEVANKAHRSNRFKTQVIEDDHSPHWNAEFEGWVLYECSKVLVIEVYDVLQVKNKSEVVLVVSKT